MTLHHCSFPQQCSSLNRFSHYLLLFKGRVYPSKSEHSLVYFVLPMGDTPDSGTRNGSNPFDRSPNSVCGLLLDGSSKVNRRAEIDTSLPFGSVKEAVTHFERSGAWIHLNKLRAGDAYLHNIGDVDIKKVEELTLELEKDLIVKELETLDVLEELGTTKRMVEDLKWQVQKEALKCMAVPNLNKQVQSPDIGEVNKENCMLLPSGAQDKLSVGSSSLCPIASPDLIITELNQAKLNLGRTINDLTSIQTSVESLNKKIRKEKPLLEKTQRRMTLKSSTTSDLNVQQRNHPQYADNEDVTILEMPADDAREVQEMNFKLDQFEKEMPVVEQVNMNVLKTAEMRLAAAKRMEAAARAAEAVAIAEIKALSRNNEGTLNFPLPEPDISSFSKALSPLSSKVPKMQKKNARETRLKNDDGVSVSRLGILKKLEDAMEEVKLSKIALEEALHRVDVANRKQLAAGEALRKWAPENCLGVGTTTATQLNHFSPSNNPLGSPHLNLPISNVENDSKPKPVLRSAVSMRDVLRRKVLPEDYTPRRHTEGRKVAPSQTLNELREDIKFPSRSQGNHQKQFMARRKKFGLIHISLPLTRPNRKKAHNPDLR